MSIMQRYAIILKLTENLKFNEEIQAFKPLHSNPNNSKPNPFGEKLIESYCSLVSHWGDMNVMTCYIDIQWILIG